jgi:hypothetical protein
MLALRYNPWFTHLIVRDNRLLSRDAANAIMNLFRHTSVLTNLDVANSSFTREAYTTLHEALMFNQSYTQLRYLDLSHTSVEDKVTAAKYSPPPLQWAVVLVLRGRTDRLPSFRV